MRNATGSLLRIRSYFFVGFMAVVIDLLALLGRSVFGLDRGIRMTLLGALVLVLGLTMVIGAAYVKANRDAVKTRIERWQQRLGSGE
jgi:hypothetical protein